MCLKLSSGGKEMRERKGVWSLGKETDHAVDGISVDAPFRGGGSREIPGAEENFQQGAGKRGGGKM